MNDRDHFAAAAMTGLLANGDYGTESTPGRAWKMADAMLRERERTNHDAAPAARASLPTADHAVCRGRDSGGGTGVTPAIDRLREWERHGSGRWGLGAAGDVTMLEHRLAMVEAIVHDAAPAARARTDADRGRTDKAGSRPGEGTGDTSASGTPKMSSGEPMTDHTAGQREPSAPSCGYPPVLDACCGGRMMWFDKNNPAALFMDKRNETVAWTQRDSTSGSGGTYTRNRTLEIRPDIVGDFTSMEFPDETFHLVVFDPPHFDSLGDNSFTAKKYGKLFANWETELSEGFRECFRVLRPLGVLVFKWNSHDIDRDRVLALSPVPPLFGHTTGRQSKTHWVCFMKPPSFE